MATHNHNLPTARLAAAALVAAAALTALPGCQRDRGDRRPRVIHGEAFPADNQPRHVDRFIQVQSAAAARTGATLTAAHFDGGADLNSLGRSKLDLMLRDDDAASPLVVYLDLPDAGAAPGNDADTEMFEARRDAVRAYLADAGVSGSNVEFRAGPNLDYSHPAKDGLRGLRRLSGDAAASPDAPNPDAPALGDLTTTSTSR